MLVMRLISETKAIVKLKQLRSEFRAEINDYERQARPCGECPTPGACCLDAHFVNVHISRLEAVEISRHIAELDTDTVAQINARIDQTISEYGLNEERNTWSATYPCPLYESGAGCLVHHTAKPAPCIAHACYERREDLPPDELLDRQEKRIDDLNAGVCGRREPPMPIPLALRRYSANRVGP